MTDEEFERIVRANADDIRRYILRRALLRIAARALVLAVSVTALALILGVIKTLTVLAVVAPPSVAYGWWSWHHKHRGEPH